MSLLNMYEDGHEKRRNEYLIPPHLAPTSEQQKRVTATLENVLSDKPMLLSESIHSRNFAVGVALES